MTQTRTQTLLSDPVATFDLTSAEKSFYDREGFLYLPGVIGAETVAQIRDELIEIMAASGRSYEQLCNAAGAQGKLIQSPQYLRDGVLDAYINSPNLLQIAAQLMGGPSSLYMPFSAVKAGGGGGTFHFHQDNQYTRFDGPGINLWLAVSPMSPENGCLNVVPRSHLNQTLDSQSSGDGDSHKRVTEEPKEFLPVRMHPGDVIAFSRLTVHGSGPNETNEPRFAYAVQFHCDDVSAVWDEQEPRLLKDNPRWNTSPANELALPDSKGRDGH